MSNSPQSAVRVVQSLLKSHPHLSTQQIYQTATEGLRPVLQPAHVIDTQGRIRMKKVSNMREGRRPWIPMPSAPHPNHPFKSVNFLKRTILTSLESQGLIHKARVERPIETDEERQEAIATAMRLTRKDERTAMRLKQSVPPPRIPKTTVTEFAWKMGPSPMNYASNKDKDKEKINGFAGEEEDEIDFEAFNEEKADKKLAMRMQLAWEKNRGESLPRPASEDGQQGESSTSTSTAGREVQLDEETELRWDQAVRLESKFQESQILEQKQIEERQQARRAAFKLERLQKKKERIEDEQMGRTEGIRAEKKRIEALEAIENYAKQTGEDVSGWYQELGISQGEEIPVNEDKRRRKSGFGLKKDI